MHELLLLHNIQTQSYFSLTLNTETISRSVLRSFLSHLEDYLLLSVFCVVMTEMDIYWVE